MGGRRAACGARWRYREVKLRPRAGAGQAFTSHYGAHDGIVTGGGIRGAVRGRRGAGARDGGFRRLRPVRAPAGTRGAGARAAAWSASASMDDDAALVLEPGEVALVPTGFRARLPTGFEAQIRIRSSAAFKKGLTIPNAPGTIDADYPDEWLVMIRNSGGAAARIEHGERIAQAVLARYESAGVEGAGRSGRAPTGRAGSAPRAEEAPKGYAAFGAGVTAPGARRTRDVTAAVTAPPNLRASAPGATDDPSAQSRPVHDHHRRRRALLPTARLLFASALYVAVEGTTSIAREQMASLLWPELTEETATHALRQIFYRLRDARACRSTETSTEVAPARRARCTATTTRCSRGGRRPCARDCSSGSPADSCPGYMPTVVGALRGVGGRAARPRERVAAAAARRRDRVRSGRPGTGRRPQALAHALSRDRSAERGGDARVRRGDGDGREQGARDHADRPVHERRSGPRAKELHLPATMLRKRISELYPLPPVIERDPPHTGREAEMGQLDAALLEARQGHGSAFVIAGRRGSGRRGSRPSSRARRSCRGCGSRGRAMGRHDDHRPLGAWSDLVREMRRMPGALGCDPDSLPFLERLTSAIAGGQRVAGGGAGRGVSLRADPDVDRGSGVRGGERERAHPVDRGCPLDGRVELGRDERVDQEAGRGRACWC